MHNSTSDMSKHYLLNDLQIISIPFEIVKKAKVTEKITSIKEKRLPPRKSPIIPPTSLRMSRIPLGVSVVT